jgi:RNA polymerase sigma-70 factor (ECF subfamily)
VRRTCSIRTQARGFSVGCLSTPTEPSDQELVAALRAGDEAAFARIVREWNASLLRVARIFVPSRAVAEEVVQETWVRVLGALDRFEGRSSLRTWVFRILVNTAKTRAQREGRVLPFSALNDPARVPEAAVDPDRFRPEDDERYHGCWLPRRARSSPRRSTPCPRRRRR